MRIPRLPHAATALALALLWPATAAMAQGYPRLGLIGAIGSINGDSQPFTDEAGTLDPRVLDEVARYDEVVLDAHPLVPYRPDIVAALRQRNPAIRVLAYVNGHFIWPAAQPDSTVHFPTRYWRLVRDMDGFVYDRQGGQFGGIDGPFANVNVAKVVAGRYVVAEAVADLLWDAVLRPGVFDGLFVDTFCEDISWTESPAESVDFARAGYPTRDAFLDGWKAGTDALAARLRARAGGLAVLVGNCGTSGSKYAWFDGWTRENFPFQNGGTWYANMLRAQGGYLAGDTLYRAPNHNFIASIPNDNGAQPFSRENARRVRFGLASAAMRDGWGVFMIGNRHTKPINYMAWWYDEYAVDVATAETSTSRTHAGWLGRPRGPMYQMIWLGAGPDGVGDPGFEAGLAPGWQFWTDIGATAAQDLATAAVGAASARVTVPVAAAQAWQASLRATTTMLVSSGQLHSVTFWARASKPRALRVALAYSGGDVGSQDVALGTAWQRYQVAIVPRAAARVAVGFMLAGDDGQVWIDDVHLQAGATTIYRRDFDRGAVLLNPSANDLSVPLGRDYRRIRGRVDLLTNDGAVVSQVTVRAQDALFLLSGEDVTPPATIDDLQALPALTPSAPPPN